MSIIATAQTRRQLLYLQTSLIDLRHRLNTFIEMHGKVNLNEINQFVIELGESAGKIDVSTGTVQFELLIRTILVNASINLLNEESEMFFTARLFGFPSEKHQLCHLENTSKLSALLAPQYDLLWNAENGGYVVVLSIPIKKLHNEKKNIGRGARYRGRRGSIFFFTLFKRQVEPVHTRRVLN